jgi:hypothetical protein
MSQCTLTPGLSVLKYLVVISMMSFFKCAENCVHIVIASLCTRLTDTLCNMYSVVAWQTYINVSICMCGIPYNVNALVITVSHLYSVSAKV